MKRTAVAAAATAVLLVAGPAYALVDAPLPEPTLAATVPLPEASVSPDPLLPELDAPTAPGLPLPVPSLPSVLLLPPALTVPVEPTVPPAVPLPSAPPAVAPGGEAPTGGWGSDASKGLSPWSPRPYVPFNGPWDWDADRHLWLFDDPREGQLWVEDGGGYFVMKDDIPAFLAARKAASEKIVADRAANARRFADPPAWQSPPVLALAAGMLYMFGANVLRRRAAG